MPSKKHVCYLMTFVSLWSCVFQETATNRADMTAVHFSRGRPHRRAGPSKTHTAHCGVSSRRSTRDCARTTGSFRKTPSDRIETSVNANMFPAPRQLHVDASADRIRRWAGEKSKGLVMYQPGSGGPPKHSTDRIFGKNLKFASSRPFFRLARPRRRGRPLR
jgi:hypothetical protein